MKKNLAQKSPLTPNFTPFFIYFLCFTILNNIFLSNSCAETPYETFGFENKIENKDVKHHYIEKFHKTSANLAPNTLYGPIQKKYLDEMQREILSLSKKHSVSKSNSEISEFIEPKNVIEQRNNTKEEVRAYLQPEKYSTRQDLDDDNVISKILNGIYKKLLAPATANAFSENRHFTYPEMTEILNHKYEYQKNRIVGF